LTEQGAAVEAAPFPSNQEGTMNEKRRVMYVLIALAQQIKADGIKTLVPDKLIENFTMLLEHPVPEQKLSPPGRRRFYKSLTLAELDTLIEDYHVKRNVVLEVEAETERTDRKTTPRTMESGASSGTRVAA
jgi:hypothetical protein